MLALLVVPPVRRSMRRQTRRLHHAARVRDGSSISPSSATLTNAVSNSGLSQFQLSTRDDERSAPTRRITSHRRVERVDSNTCTPRRQRCSNPYQDLIASVEPKVVQFNKLCPHLPALRTGPTQIPLSFLSTSPT